MKHKRNTQLTQLLCFLLACATLFSGCTVSAQTHPEEAASLKNAATSEVTFMDFSKETEYVIYLAGGCFWGLEQLMQSIPGVIDAQSG